MHHFVGGLCSMILGIMKLFKQFGYINYTVIESDQNTKDMV